MADRWEIPHNCLTLGEILGRGAFGQVVKGFIKTGSVLLPRSPTCSVSSVTQEDTHDSSDRRIVAVKMLLDYAEDSHRQDFLKEIELMKTIGYHANVVSIIGCCTLMEPLCLIVEHMPEGDLLHYLQRNRHLMQEREDPEDTDSQLTLADMYSFARQISVGMEFLSQKGFVHRDLATRNILVGKHKTIKIGDFGLTRYIYDDKIYVTHKGGKLPLKWMAIESIFDLTFTTASDVWAFGVVLFELITLGGVPYPTIANRDLLRALKSGYRMEKPENCSEDLYQMMRDCWQERPSARPSFTILRNQLEAMIEETSSAEYLCIHLDDSKDYYCFRDSQVSADGDSVLDEESEVFTSPSPPDTNSIDSNKESVSPSSSSSSSPDHKPCSRLCEGRGSPRFPMKLRVVSKDTQALNRSSGYHSAGSSCHSAQELLPATGKNQKQVVSQQEETRL